eukprot:3491972-Pyramimonas_sp.AAC.1
MERVVKRLSRTCPLNVASATLQPLSTAVGLASLLFTMHFSTYCAFGGFIAVNSAVDGLGLYPLGAKTSSDFAKAIAPREDGQRVSFLDGFCCRFTT